MVNELSNDQMKVRKVHRLDCNDLPAFVKAGNLDTLLGFCSIRMMYDDLETYRNLEKKFWVSQEKNSHMFNQEGIIELMMRGDEIRRKLLKLKNESIPNNGIRELLEFLHDVHRIEEERHESDMFKTHVTKQKKLLKIKKLAYDFNQSEITLEIDPIVRFNNMELYDKLMSLILSHQYVVEQYPNLEMTHDGMISAQNIAAIK